MFLWKVPWRWKLAKLTAINRSAYILQQFTYRSFMNLNSKVKRNRINAHCLLFNNINKMGFKATNILLQKDFYKILGVNKGATKDEIK